MASTSLESDVPQPTLESPASPPGRLESAAPEETLDRDIADKAVEHRGELVVSVSTVKEERRAKTALKQKVEAMEARLSELSKIEQNSMRTAS